MGKRGRRRWLFRRKPRHSEEEVEAASAADAEALLGEMTEEDADVKEVVVTSAEETGEEQAQPDA